MPRVVSLSGDKLQAFDLEFFYTKTIKSGILASFLTEWTPSVRGEAKDQSTLPGHEDPEHWVMKFDCAFSFQGTGAGVMFTSSMGEQLFYAMATFFYANGYFLR